jgi:hypothetical protein
VSLSLPIPGKEGGGEAGGERGCVWGVGVVVSPLGQSHSPRPPRVSIGCNVSETWHLETPFPSQIDRIGPAIVARSTIA